MRPDRKCSSPKIRKVGRHSNTFSFGAKQETGARQMSRWPGNSQLEQTTFGGLNRGNLMSRIRSKGNFTTERRMATLLRSTGLSGWRRHFPIDGHPDFAWPHDKVALFVDGCFWHGHNCNRNLSPKTNADVWAEKIKHTRARDLRTRRRLHSQGWHVLRVWECQITSQRHNFLAKISNLLAHV
jgi:DNA mismatch endonuclease (patch repair protein)